MDKDKLLIESLIKTVKELTGRVEKLEAENNFLRKENDLLKAEIVKLKAQINTNSHNSNKPPSSDGYKKKSAFPRKKKGKCPV